MRKQVNDTTHKINTHHNKRDHNLQLLMTKTFDNCLSDFVQLTFESLDFLIIQNQEAKSTHQVLITCALRGSSSSGTSLLACMVNLLLFFCFAYCREGQQLEDWVKREASHRCPHMFVTCRRSQCFLAFFTDVDAPQLAGRVRFEDTPR